MRSAVLIVLALVCTDIFSQTIQIKDKSSLLGIANATVNGMACDENGRIELDRIALSKHDNFYLIGASGYFSDSLTYLELQKADFTVYLTERSFDWNGVVVSASRFEEKSTDVSQPIHVISKKDMRFMNQPNTADLLMQTGDVFIQKSQVGGGSVSMRGFEANKVLMVIDGVRMNNAIYRGGHLQNVLSIDNSLLEKTEILFGPGSVVYGSDALGGVLHFYTRDPILASGKKKELKAMSYVRIASGINETTSHLDLNLGYRHFAALTSITYSSFGDLTIGKNPQKGYESWGRRTFIAKRIDGKDSMVVNGDSFTQVPSAYKQLDLMQKFLYSKTEKVKHLLNFQYSSTSDVPRYDRLSELNSKGQPTQAEWYYGPQKRLLAAYNLRIARKCKAYEKANITAAFQDVRESRHNRSFGSSNLNNRYEKVNVYSLNADFQKQLGLKTEMRYGAEYVYNSVTSTAKRISMTTGTESKLDTRYPDGGSNMQTAALYAMQNTYFSKNVILNTGIRMTQIYLRSVFNDKTYFPFLQNSVVQNNQNTSGNVGLVVLGKNDLKFAFNIASGFRAPNVDDMAKVFESTDGRVIIPNRFLRPERTMNYDFTVSKVLQKKLRLELNAFYTVFTDALTLGKAQLNGSDTINFEGKTSQVYSTQNAQEAYIYGACFTMDWDILHSLEFNFKANYTYGRIRTDSTPYPLDHIAPLFGRTGLKYKTKKWKFEVFSIFNGAKRSKDYNLLGEDNQRYSADPQNGYSPAWITYNVRGYRQIDKFYQLQFSIENIADKHYRTFSSGSSASGRMFMITLRANF